MNNSIDYFVDNNYCPLALPHYKIVDKTLCTLNNRTVKIPYEVLEIYKLCDGKRTVRDIDSFGALEFLNQKRVITFVPGEGKTNHPQKDYSQNVLVISPHIDDAALSVGGIIHKGTRLGKSFTVLNIFSRQEFQTGIRVPEECIHDIAAAEDEIAGRCLGYESINAGLKGAAERYNLPMNKFIGLEIGDIISSREFSKDAVTVKNILKQQLEQKEYHCIMSPMGIGGHLDHLIVSYAVHLLITDNELDSKGLVYYEDLPYSMAFPWLIDKRSQPLFYGLEEKQLIDIKGELTAKIAALRVFCTRIREQQIESAVKYAGAYSSHFPIDFSEALWKWEQSINLFKEGTCIKL
jgi:LmbE family N-acetylglucosaminyl deacetylase